MKIVIVYFLGFMFLGWSSVAGDKPEYAASKIPDQLRKDADYVIREQNKVFRVVSINKATLSVRRVVTLLNSKAAVLAELGISYSKTIKVKSIKGAIYDQYGRELDKIKTSDIADFNAISSGQFIDDYRVKVVKADIPSYPITIEHEYEVEYNGIFFYPAWQPRPGIRVSVEHSEFTVVTPDVIPLRTRNIFLDVEPEIKVADGLRTYRWEASQWAAIKERESYQPDDSNLFPRLLAAPATFEYEGFKGNMETWENFGHWTWQLNQGRDQLPDATVSMLRQMTEGLGDRAKVERLYKHLQAKTRYVGIQLGIGGLQTFEASFVDQVGYGDCKALSNYMKAMLKSVGIPSYMAIVKAGDLESDIAVDFPSQQFNHVILCVPMTRDTVWLECTNQNMPFGYLGQFTSNRHALLITEEGGKLVKTRFFSPEENYLYRNIEVQLDENGKAVAELETKYGGYQSDAFVYLKTKKFEDQKKAYYEMLAVSGVEIGNLSFSQKDNDLGEVIEKLSLSINKYATVGAKRLTFCPNLLNKQEFNLSDAESRAADIEIKYGYYDADTVKIFLPDKFYPEFLPEEKMIESEFGSYYTKTIPGERNITYIRIRKQNMGLYPAAKYREFADFIREISKADNVRIVLRSET